MTSAAQSCGYACNRRRPLIVSVAAGIRSDDIDELARRRARRCSRHAESACVAPARCVIRSVRECAHRATSRRNAPREIMSAVGHVVDVSSEADIDAVTAMSGTRPRLFLPVDRHDDQRPRQDFGLDAAGGTDPDDRNGQAVRRRSPTPKTRRWSRVIERVRSPGGTTTAAFDSLEADTFVVSLRRAFDRRERSRRRTRGRSEQGLTVWAAVRNRVHSYS